MTTRSFVLTMLLSLAAATSFAQTIEGDWQGTVPANGTQVRLVLHLKADGHGGLVATLDSPDQGASGIPVSSVSFVDSTLKFAVAVASVSYEGKADTRITAIAGTFSQGGMSTPLTLSRVAASASATRVRKPSDVDGDWEGALDAGGMTFRLIVHVQTFEDGITATLDSPDQNVRGLPISSVTRTGAKVQLELKPLGASFEGTLDPKLTSITGEWRQSGNLLPLVLTRR